MVQERILYPWVQLLHNKVTVGLTLWETSRPCSKGSTSFYSQSQAQQYMKVSVASHSHQHLILFIFFKIIIILIGMKKNLIVNLTDISLMAINVDHLFSCSYWQFISSMEKMSIPLLIFKLSIFVYLLLNYKIYVF